MRAWLPVVWLVALASVAQAQLQWHSTGPGGGGAFESASVGPKGDVIVGSDLSGAYRSFDGGGHWDVIGSARGLRDTHVDATAQHPLIDGMIYLGAGDGLYRSTDCQAKADAPCHFDRSFEGYVTAIATAGAGDVEHAMIYAAGLEGYCLAGPKFWRSFDAGANWEEVKSRGLPAEANVMALRVMAGATQNIIAISTPERASGPKECGAEKWPKRAPSRAFLSTDGGQHFAPLDIAPSSALSAQGDAAVEWAFIEDAKFDAQDPHRIWIAVAPNPENPGGAEINGNGEVWLSDGRSGLGQDFKRVSAGHTGQIWPLSNGGIRLLDLRRQKPWLNRPYNSADETGFWQWNHLNKSWRHVTSAADYAQWDMGWNGLVHASLTSLNGDMQSFTPVSDDEAWLVDEQFTFKTGDGGRVVKEQFADVLPNGGFVSRKIDNAVPGVLAPSPLNADLLYAGYFDMGCWFTNAATQREPALGWRDCNGPKSKLEKGKLLQGSPLNDWWLGFGGDTTALAFDPEDADRVWAVHARGKEASDAVDGGHYKIAVSADQFHTWQDLTFDLNVQDQGAAITALLVDAPQPTQRRVWAIAGNHLYLLAVAAEHWLLQTTGKCNGQMLVMAGKGDTLLLGGASGVCVSHDKGKSWHWWRNAQAFGEAKPTWWGPWGDALQGASDFAFDPHDANIVWMTVMLPSFGKDERRAGLYKSMDGGDSWKQIESFAVGAFERNFTRSVAVNPADSNMIVVGTSSALLAGGNFEKPKQMGAFISRDGGKTWALQNAGLAWPFITKLRFTSGPHPRLFGISPGQGIVFSDLP